METQSTTHSQAQFLGHSRWWGMLTLILLAIAISFSGRTLMLGSIDPGWTRQVVIRVEDIIIVLLGIGLIAHWLVTGKKGIARPPLYPILIFWILFEFVSSLINATLGYLAISRAPFYTLKAIEYAFIFYYVYSHLKTESDVVTMMRVWLAIIWVHLAYIAYQFINPTHYGIWLIGEQGNFNIGGQFVILFLYTFSFYLFYFLRTSLSRGKKILLGILSIVPMVGVFTAGIKAGAVAGMIGLLILLGFYLLKTQSFRALLHVGTVALLCMVLFGALALATRSLPYDFIYYRTLNIDSYSNSLNFRANLWVDTLNTVLSNPLHTLIGRGGGDPIAEASHNQYVRNFAAGGLIGFLLFAILIISIMKTSLHAFFVSKRPLIVAFGAALFASTISMLILGISGESFFIVRPAEHYWYFAGIALASMSLLNR